MKTLEKLREEYNNLNKKRNAIYRKIVELERQEVTNTFTVGECYLDTIWNNLIKIVSIKDNYVYYIRLDEACITRDNFYIYDIEDWKKITSHQFKDAYLATMKDIRDPDFEEGPESNWNKALNSIINSINKEE